MIKVVLELRYVSDSDKAVMREVIPSGCRSVSSDGPICKVMVAETITHVGHLAKVEERLIGIPRWSTAPSFRYATRQVDPGASRWMIRWSDTNER